MAELFDAGGWFGCSMVGLEKRTNTCGYSVRASTEPAAGNGGRTKAERRIANLRRAKQKRTRTALRNERKRRRTAAESSSRRSRFAGVCGRLFSGRYN